jgi:hypothetical protein
MKMTERHSFFSVMLAISLSTVALAGAVSCMRDMTVGGAIDQQGHGGSGGTSGADAGTFACGSATCIAGRDFCLTGPNGGQCSPLPTACAGTASCGCVCSTPAGGPGFCTETTSFNRGQEQCSCQNLGATTNVAVWCAVPTATGSGGNGGSGAGGASGSGGAGGTSGSGGAGGSGASGTFQCGAGTCNAGTEFCVVDPALTHCMPLPQGCTVTGSACGCACQTESGGPGTCPNPALFNEGLRQCSCQNVGATTNAIVSCQ